MSLEKVYSQSIRVRTYECGPEGTVYPHDLLCQMQEVASMHADKLQWGFADLQPRGLFWVLAVIRVEIITWPRFGSEFVLSTWPSGLNRILASREFLGTDCRGKTLFAAGSQWMVLNREKSRPENLLRMDKPFPVREKQAISGQLCRSKPSQGSGSHYTLRVPSSALDINGHVNNTEYLRWAYDTLCQQQIRPTCTQFQVSYHTEAFAGDELEFGITTENNSLGVSGFQAKDKKAVVTVVFSENVPKASPENRLTLCCLLFQVKSSRVKAGVFKFSAVSLFNVCTSASGWLWR